MVSKYSLYIVVGLMVITAILMAWAAFFGRADDEEEHPPTDNKKEPGNMSALELLQWFWNATEDALFEVFDGPIGFCTIREKYTPEEIILKIISYEAAKKNEELEKQETERKLTEYENYANLEKQGLLLRLPCKIGDTLYIVACECQMIGDCQEKLTCHACEHLSISIDEVDATLNVIAKYMDYFGKTVFLTKEEAEAKTAELRDEQAAGKSSTIVNYPHLTPNGVRSRGLQDGDFCPGS